MPNEQDVNFVLAIKDIGGAGLTRTVTAQITNTGNSDAHNAWARIEVFSRNNRIRLCGSDSLTVDIGTLDGGATVTRQEALQFGFFDGMKIAQNGARVTLTIYSDEKTMTFNYDYQT